MIRHVVMWRLKDSVGGVPKGEIAMEIKEQLESLPSQIPEIQQLEVGINIKDSDAACDVALYSAFNSMEDLAAYQHHPEHKKVADFIWGAVEDRFVVDYKA